jgi:NADH:ubiquinone oxidoreductase subunit F (NADH-binding)
MPVKNSTRERPAAGGLLGEGGLLCSVHASMLYAVGESSASIVDCDSCEACQACRIGKTH